MSDRVRSARFRPDGCTRNASAIRGRRSSLCLPGLSGNIKNFDFIGERVGWWVVAARRARPTGPGQERNNAFRHVRLGESRSRRRGRRRLVGLRDVRRDRQVDGRLGRHQGCRTVRSPVGRRRARRRRRACRSGHRRGDRVVPGPSGQGVRVGRSLRRRKEIAGPGRTMDRVLATVLVLRARKKSTAGSGRAPAGKQFWRTARTRQRRTRTTAGST